MTQIELEAKFDASDRAKILDELYAETSMQVTVEDRNALSKIMLGASPAQVDEVLVNIVMLTAIESNGSKIYKISGTNVSCSESHEDGEYQNARVMSLNSFVSSIFGMKSLITMFPFPQQRFDIALDLILELKSPLYEIDVGRKVEFEEGWRTVQSVVMKDILPPWLAEKFEFSWYLPPMLTQPLEWHEDQKGGYLMHPIKMVKGRGYQAQPEKVCHALNVQQSMVWELNKWCSVEEEIQYVHDKNMAVLEKDYTSRDIDELTKRTTVSLGSSYNMLKENNKFFFVWDYDYRGRSYCRGYNQNPQG